MTLPLLRRIGADTRAPLAFWLDGRACEAREGDTVLTAVLLHGARVRHTEAMGAPRAGFCFMGACQDCWMWLEDGRRVRACSDALQAGMRLRTAPPDPEDPS